MAWTVTVTPTGPCGFSTTVDDVDVTCEHPATTRTIDDNGVEHGVWCRGHAIEFLTRLRAVS